MERSVRRAVLGLCAAGALAAAAPAAAQAGTWTAATPAPGRTAAITASHLGTFRLDAASMKSKLAAAPRAGLNTRALAAGDGTTITLPAPDGTMQRFEVQDSPVMAPELAALHPEIHTYAGRGLDDRTATIRADETPLGFHASVRSDRGNWYIDPYYHGDTSLYASYYGHDLVDQHGPFVERDVARLSEADPLGLGTKRAAAAGSTVQLRTYRLALLSDPTYATYWGAANVTAAKVVLMNRVDQVYEDELAIRMILIGQTDKLNLNTDAQATQPHGPCGAQACYSPESLEFCDNFADSGPNQQDTLTRNRVVLGQLVGAGAYDIGHIALGVDGGGVADLGVVGDDLKAEGCTGIPTPQGDFYAVDYVAHEMGHEFGGNHTFNGVNSNCGGGNRNGATSVEPGSGSSIMAYAGICRHDDLQPHSDPYFSERSYDEITAYTSSSRPAINEVQNVALDGFDGTDALTVGFGGAISRPLVRGTNYSGADISGVLNGNEAQWAQLSGFDTDGESFRLDYDGVDSVPIVRGQNNTAAGIRNALQGGNETQAVALGGFDPTAQSFQITLNGNTSPVIGAGGTAFSNGNVAAAVSSLLGCASSCAGVAGIGAGSTAFTVTFTGAQATTDVPQLAIVNCTTTCTPSVRTTAQGGKALSSWPAGATVAVGSLPDTAPNAPSISDSGFTLAFGGALAGKDVDLVTLADVTGALALTRESTKGGQPPVLPAGATASVTGYGDAGPVDSTGFQVTFDGGTLAHAAQPALSINLAGGDGFSANVGEIAHGGAVQNQGIFVTDTGNHAPAVTAPAAFTIPTRTPFSLTGSATDADGDPLTYMWEQNDTGNPARRNSVGTALTSNTKTTGPLFRQFGTRAVVSATDTLLSPSPGENAVDANPTRVFPDMAQIVSGNTNAATGQCPPDTFAPTDPVPASIVDCYSEFLPTADWVGVLGDRTMNFRLTARDHHPNGGGIGSAATKVTIAPLAGPFRVTAPAIPQTMYAQSPQTVRWDVAGTDQPPVSASQVKISLSTDGGMTYPYTLAAAAPNTGSARVVLPDVTADAARFKVEAVGNVFFDISHADVKILPAPTSTIGGTVPATLALTLGGAPASFGSFTPGATQDYSATNTATVTSSAGDAALSVSDPDTAHPGHLVNGGFALPSAVQADANGGAFGAVSSSPLTVLTFAGPVSANQVLLGFHQHVDRLDALRTGSYSKTLTFTLSTTNP
jgi:hypothetical protein